MAKARDTAETPTELRLRIFAVRAATLLGKMAARLTNIEVALMMRKSVNQDLPLPRPGGFSNSAWDYVSTSVRDEILANLFGADGAVAAEEPADVSARAGAGPAK